MIGKYRHCVDNDDNDDGGDEYRHCVVAVPLCHKSDGD